jgi:hypothetical protein
MLKIVNRRIEGSLFHYAHFLCDCLFPEIVSGVYKYNQVYREKNIYQTLGNFNKIYTDVMRVEHTELIKEDFDNLKLEPSYYKTKELLCNMDCFNKFRSFIFKRYEIDPKAFDTSYPEVILIKRHDRIQLIDDEDLNKVNRNIKTGKERREIQNIESVEKYLINKYNHKFKSIYLEFTDFEEQVKYFNNAKLIICAHGAGMSNMFFCKPGTKIIEVTCGMKWPFFDVISRILKLNHIKQPVNTLNRTLNCIQVNRI